jgi:ketosteroid isomerase-like protein
MDDHPHVETARRFWLSVAKGDAAGIHELLSPDVRWRTHSAGDLSGEIEGAEDVIAMLARSGELVEELRSDLIDILVSERGVTMLYHVSAERSGQRLETDVVLIARIVEGRIEDVQTVPVDADANRRFWSAS